MLTNYRRGLVAEWLSVFVLMLKGYRIIKHRYKTKFGEIDLIAAKKGTIVFIEVKWRQTMESGLEAINQKTQQRIINAAKHFMAKQHQMSKSGAKNSAIVDGYRFDVVVWRSIFHFSHIKNAFWEQH